MLSRIPPSLLAFGASLLLLAGLVGALYWTPRAATSGEPLELYCAEAMRVPMQAIAQEYEQEHGQKVIIHFGASQTMLTNFELRGQGDLFLPADESYMRLAGKKKLVRDVTNLARMRAVVIVSPQYAQAITSWNDFLAPGHRIGLANEAAAIGKILRQELESKGLWEALAQREPKSLGNVNEVANSTRLGSVDVGIVWDVVARPHADLKVVHLKELEGVQARVQIAVASASTQPDAARRFIRHVRARDKGAIHLKEQGYADVEEGEAMDTRRELLVYAGAMLRPALEAALIEFEKRENVRIIRVYNGCGILVSQMQTGETPDVYFSCDARFMTQVQEQFKAPTIISSNQLVIALKKGNPHKVHELTDLGQAGLRVGIGHEQQCALGALTKETLVRKGVYARVMKNVVVQSPTGDFLINQLRTGSLDVVVAYRSNVIPFGSELEAIPITGIPCAAPQQPIAVSKNSAHPELSQRLLEFLGSEESRQRFEKLGFGWELKEAPAGP